MDGAATELIGQLSRLVDSDAAAVLDAASSGLAAPDVELDVAANLWWLAGQAERNLGNLEQSRTSLEHAIDLSTRLEAPALTASIRSSLGFVVARLGDLDQALHILHEAEDSAEGSERSRVLGQIGVVLYWKGELNAAADHLRRCCDALCADGDEVGEARYQTSLGGVLTQLSRFDEAEVSLRRSAELALANGMHTIAGTAHHNLGYTASRQGDLAGSLHDFELAEEYMVRGNASNYLGNLYEDHARALADAGLFADAATMLDQAIGLYREQGQQTEYGGALLASAESALRRGEVEAAAAAAAAAGKTFAGQGRESWAALAKAIELQADARSAEPAAGIDDQLDAVADRLVTHGWRSAAIRCRLLAARLRAAGESPRAIPAELRAEVESGQPADRILLAHIDACLADRDGDLDGARAAVDRGLAVAVETQSALGSIETRAHAAAHGFELVELGARFAIDAGEARELLSRIEATRVMAARLPAVRPPADPQMSALLAELRIVEAVSADPSATAEVRATADGERARLEQQVRRRSRLLRGDGGAFDLGAEIAESIERLGGRQLLAHAALGGRLYAVTVESGRARLHELGSLDEVKHAVEGVAFALHRLNRAQGSDASRVAASELLFGLAAELADLVLPDNIADSSESAVVVPTAVLHDVAWGLLPPLAGRGVSVNASLTGWARATRRRDEAPMSTSRRVGFVAGPALEFGDLEVTELASYYPDSVVLRGDAATGDRCLELMADTDTAHVACHGTFRSDNPLFSSIHVADGPLNVYDFERVERLPDTVVLSACSVAGAKVIQGGSVLGLATALTTLGACSVIAPLTPISDAASVLVMQRLHHALRAGAAPAEALAMATLAHDLADPTAAAFISLGA